MLCDRMVNLSSIIKKMAKGAFVSKKSINFAADYVLSSRHSIEKDEKVFIFCYSFVWSVVL